MRLRQSEVDAYKRDGFVLVANLFDTTEVRHLCNEAELLLNKDAEGRVLEEDGVTPRSFNGAHLHSAAMHTLCQLGRLVEPSRTLLDDNVYVYQTKINAKRAFCGDLWSWHFDYEYWLREDGMPAANALTAVLFLDDVHEHNGPMLVIPGSHRELEADRAHNVAAPPEHQPASREWLQHTSKKLKYTLKKEVLAQWIEKRGICPLVGPRGSVVFFNSLLFHSSNANISPWDRRLILVTYNAVSNSPLKAGVRRPEFLVSRDMRPIEVVSDVVLLAERHGFL